jgi:tRNA dimethylallyltransferase
MLAAVPAVPIVALFGPTGVGKTDVAIALAELLRADGEDPVAVSADALQLYAGLEILTGAASAEERARLEHRLVGILPVTARATAGDYARRAHAEIDALIAAGRRPIVVGGTGLYLRAALAELDLRPPPDPALRSALAARLASSAYSGAGRARRPRP